MTIIFEIVALCIAVLFFFDIMLGFRMTKSIFNRFRLKAEIAAEQLRDPVADAAAALASIKSKRAEMVELRKTLLTNVHSSKTKAGRAKSDAENFENLAKLAGKAGNADDVKTALEKKKAAETRHANHLADATRFQAQEDTVENQIKEFDVLIETAEQNAEHLKSELSIQKFDKSVAETLKNNSGSALSAIEQLTKDVEHARASAAVANELAGEAKTLESKYAKIETVTDDDVSKYLNA
jgi:phage shock protein A